MTPNDRPPHDPELREQVTRLRQFMRRAVRFWPTLAGTLVLGGLAFCVFSFVRQPHYRSETVILYVERRGPEETAGGEAAKQAVTVRLKELLFARPNLERVINKFGLYPDVRRRYGMVDAVEELKKHIDFKAPGGDTFSIAFEGTSPSQAQQVTQELSRLVIEGDSALRKSQARASLEFLSGERKLRETELRAAEEQLAAFMAKHLRFALDATPLANGAAIRATMAEPTPATPAAGAPPVRWPPPIRAAAPGAPKALGGSAVPPSAAPAPAANAAEEGRARAALAAANENLADKLGRYTPAHPDVKAAEAAVQRANERLAALAAAAPAPAATPPKSEPVAEGPSPAAATPPAAPAAPAAKAGPAGAPRIAAAPAMPVRGSAGAQEDLVAMETDWLRLTRAVTEARQRQDQIETQLFRADIQVSSATGGHGAQVDVIDPAFLPQRPQPPGRATVAALFLLGSLLIGLLVTLLRAFLDERVFVAAEVAEVSEVLVEIPRVMKRRAHAAT